MDRDIILKHLIQIGRYVRNCTMGRVKGHHLGGGQMDILRLLSHTGDGINQEEISKRLSLDNTTVARTVKRLEESGFVKKIKDENDKRVKRVYLTQKAKDLKSFIVKMREEMINKITNGIDDDELEKFEATLSKMYENARKQSERRCASGQKK